MVCLGQEWFSFRKCLFRESRPTHRPYFGNASPASSARSSLMRLVQFFVQLIDLLAAFFVLPNLLRDFVDLIQDFPSSRVVHYCGYILPSARGHCFYACCKGHGRCFSHASTTTPMPTIRAKIASHTSSFIQLLGPQNEAAVPPNGGLTYTCTRSDAGNFLIIPL